MQNIVEINAVEGEKKSQIRGMGACCFCKEQPGRPDCIVSVFYHRRRATWPVCHNHGAML